MGLFTSKVPPAKEVGLEELVKLVDSHSGILVGMNKRISDLEIETERLKSHIISLRGYINRKLSEGDLETEKETSKSVDGLDSLRRL